MMKAVFFVNDKATADRVYRSEQIEAISKLFEIADFRITEKNAKDNLEILRSVDVILSTWGMPVLPEELIDEMKNLKIIFYSAGTVKYFAEPYLKRGVRIISAASANGEFVAKYTMSEIFLCGKGFFRDICGLDEKVKRAAHGSYRMKVGIIGAGNIGRMMIKMLIEDGQEVLVYDPYLKEDLGAKITTLEEIFSTCDIVSNHAPNIPSTVGMLNKPLFESMPQGAYFINTGRGATVVEDEMVEVFEKRPDLTALLDVTWPEPPVPGSPITQCKNIIRTPHIAGTIGTEVTKMADYCAVAMREFLDGKELCQGEVTLEMLPRLA